MAIRAQNLKQRRQNLAPELAADADDPDMHFVETINIADSENCIELEDQVAESLWRDLREDEYDSAEDSNDQDEEDAGELQSQRMVMEMMMSGEHPDAEIDKLLESYGVQLS